MPHNESNPILVEFYDDPFFSDIRERAQSYLDVNLTDMSQDASAWAWTPEQIAEAKQVLTELAGRMKGVQFDHAGNMAAVRIDGDSTMSHLYEHIGCKVVTPLEIHAGLVLWIDAEGPKNGQRLNEALTELAATLGLDLDGKLAIYGPGVFLGGTATHPQSLSADNRLQIVLTHLRNIVPTTR